MRRYPFLSTLLSPFDKRHRKTLALVIAAIATTGQARSFAIATTMMGWLGTRLDSAINRFYRLLRNDRVDYTRFVTQWARLLVRSPDRHLVVAVDWTEWHHDLHMLVAAVVTGKRAIPLYAQAFQRLVRLRSQNARENTFLRVLSDCLRWADVTATLLFDRGFRRISCIELLHDLQLGFVIRLMDDVTVQTPAGIQMPLRDLLLTPGKPLDLGVVALRSDRAVRVRVVGYWAPGRNEPWWLATSLDCRASRVVSFYDRRMTVEHSFRDFKSLRFGFQLRSVRLTKSARYDRLLLIAAVALLLLVLIGLSVECRNLHRTYKANTDPSRTHSLFQLGLAFLNTLRVEPTPRFLRACCDVHLAGMG